MFEDIIGKSGSSNMDKSCLNCNFYIEGVILPGGAKTIDICQKRGIEFKGEITSDCNEYEVRVYV